MKFYYLTLALGIMFFSCNNTQNQQKDIQLTELLNEKKKENELKERELAIREEELIRREEEEKQKKLNAETSRSLSEIYHEVRKAVYIIFTENDRGTSQGSAFVITPKGIAVSNYHVLEDASEAVLFNDTQKKFIISEIITFDKENDYIIFKIDPVRDSIPYLKIASSLPEIGENVFAVGNPKGLTQTLSNGLVTSYRRNDLLIQTNTQITHGSSGGPLFNSKGEVIGITTMGLDEPDLNFAVNIKKLPLSATLVDDYSFVKTSKINDDRVKELIRDYYLSIDNDSYDQIFYSLAHTLKRYYKYFNISRNEVLEKAKNYKKVFGVLSTESKIRWNTLDIIDNANTKTVMFIMDYSIKRFNTSKPSKFVLHMIIEINSENKIQSIYENILSKN